MARKLETKDKIPRVETSRLITVVLPDGAYGFGGTYDLRFCLTHEEADALADKLREAARETRRSLD